MNDPDPKWQKLLAAARRAKPAVESPAPPPPGLAARVLGLRATIIALARVLFWRRWSRWVALLCVAVFAIIAMIHRCTESPAPLIEIPEPPSTQPMIR